MVINTLAIFLFLDREMHLTAALHGAYLVISVFGWRNWFVDYHRQRSMLFPLSGSAPLDGGRFRLF